MRGPTFAETSPHELPISAGTASEETQGPRLRSIVGGIGLMLPQPDKGSVLITLYQLHWSHYVEKVVLALEFKRIPWCAVDIHAFSKREMRHFDCQQYVPLLHDTLNSIALSDSTPILKYLDDRFPAEPALFPGDEQMRDEVHRWTLALDTHLGIPARRIAYTHMIVENPRLLADLFLSRQWQGVLNLPVLRNFSSAVVGMILQTRFRLHRNRKDRIYERLDAFLNQVVAQLGDSEHLLGHRMTAADLTLAALLRPLRVSPHFASDPKFAPLFQHQERIFHLFKRPSYPYEDSLTKVRSRKPLAKHLHQPIVRDQPDALVSMNREEALNDQQPVYHWRFLMAPFFYLQLRSQLMQ